MSISINAEKAAIGIMASLPIAMHETLVTKQRLEAISLVPTSSMVSVEQIRSAMQGPVIQPEFQRKVSSIETLVKQIFKEIRVGLESFERFVKYSFLALQELEKGLRSMTQVRSGLDPIFSVIRPILQESHQLVLAN